MVFFSLLEDQVSDMQHLGRWGYFFRAPVKRHVRRPPDEEIAKFQKELAELIPQKIEEGYTVAVQDETIVTVDARPRRVYTRKGRRPVCTVTGSHEKTAVYTAETKFVYENQAFA